MNINKTDFGVFIIEPYVFEDHRGEYIEIYNEDSYHYVNGIDVHFVQDDISISRKNVLRGIHGDTQTWKLISCLHGKLYVVVVNCDEESMGFGEWKSFIISDRSYRQILIPPKYGNSFLVLSDKAIFHYKQSSYYCREKQFTYKWNDPRFNIYWPINNPILSERDK